MKNIIPLLLAGLLFTPAAAQERRNVMETLTAALEGDRAYDAAERSRLLGAIRDRFADYGVQVVTPERRPAIPVVLAVITEGSFDEAPPERVADVAFAAYQAMSRGAPAEEVEGIALYGYRKKIAGDTIAAWANGYRQLVDAKVPAPVAADLVNLAMARDLSVSDFDTLKWSLADGVKEGYDAKDYATYLFGNMILGKSGPGGISGGAKAEFRRARAEKRRPRLPDYAGSFSPKPPPPPTYEAPVKAPDEPAKVAPPSAAPAAPPLRPHAVVPSAPEHQAAPSRPSAPVAPVAPIAPERRESPAVGDSPKMAALWPGLEGTYHAYLGTPYVWGGTSHAGIDCSGLTGNTYGENRVKIPRVSRDQFHTGSLVADNGLRNGDLVFFNTLGAGVSHVGMVVDAKTRRFVQASSSKGVTVSDLDGKYYKTRYLGARRVVP
jgi:cell wall-associated NlpC family hydrolase